MSRVPYTEKTEDVTKTITEDTRDEQGALASSSATTFSIVSGYVLRLPSARLSKHPIGGKIGSLMFTINQVSTRLAADATKIQVSASNHTPISSVKNWINDYVKPSLKVTSLSKDGNYYYATINGTFKSLYEVTGITTSGAFRLEIDYINAKYQYYDTKTTKQYKAKFNGKEYTKIKLNGVSME